eukprot:5238427-Prymnesium_polylepis.1
MVEECTSAYVPTAMASRWMRPTAVSYLASTAGSPAKRRTVRMLSRARCASDVAAASAACVPACRSRIALPAHRIRATAAGKVIVATAQRDGEMVTIMPSPPVTMIKPRAALIASVVNSFCSDVVSDERRLSSSPVSV